MGSSSAAIWADMEKESRPLASGHSEVPANPVNHQVRNTLLEALVAFSGQTIVHLE